MINKYRINLFFVFALIVLLSSCKNNNLVEKSINTPARDFLLDGEAESNDYTIHGYILLSSKLDNSQRYLKICESYLRHFDPVSDFKGDNPSINLIPTYWLLNSDARVAVDAFGYQILLQMTCNEYVELYDYPRAKTLLSKAKKLSANGPVLAAWSTRGIGHKLLTFDISNFDENDSDRAMLIWKERITMNPNVWNNGLKLVIVREELRSFLQKYGDEIISVISV